MYCKNCGAEVPDGSKFCPSCGKPVLEEPKPSFCRECGSQLRPGETVCQSCGAEVAPLVKSAPVQEQGDQRPLPRNVLFQKNTPQSWMTVIAGVKPTLDQLFARAGVFLLIAVLHFADAVTGRNMEFLRIRVYDEVLNLRRRFRSGNGRDGARDRRGRHCHRGGSIGKILRIFLIVPTATAGRKKKQRDKP